MPSVMNEAHENICQQDCQHVGQIMPAAILTAAEKAAEAKEQAIRRRHQLPDEAQIFADGFAIGLAFLLQVGTPASLTVLLDQQNTTALFDIEQHAEHSIDASELHAQHVFRFLQAARHTCRNSIRPRIW